jgi:phosphoglucomutase
MVSYDCYAEHARGGIVITASHNPPQFSGFKIKLPFGGSAPPEYTLQVENRLDANPPQARQDCARLLLAAKYSMCPRQSAT